MNSKKPYCLSSGPAVARDSSLQTKSSSKNSLMTLYYGIQRLQVTMLIYIVALQQLAEAYVNGKPSHFRDSPKHYAQAFSSFQALHSFLNNLYAKFQHRLYRKPAPLKWKQLQESIENTHKPSSPISAKTRPTQFPSN